jgi:hypothetical protein
LNGFSEVSVKEEKKTKQTQEQVVVDFSRRSVHRIPSCGLFRQFEGGGGGEEEEEESI